MFDVFFVGACGRFTCGIALMRLTKVLQSNLTAVSFFPIVEGARGIERT